MALTPRRQCQLLLVVSIGASYAGLTYAQYGGGGLALALLAIVLFYPLMGVTRRLDLAQKAGQHPGPMPTWWRIVSLIQIAWITGLVSFHGYLLFHQLSWWGPALLVGVLVAFDRSVRLGSAVRAS